MFCMGEEALEQLLAKTRAFEEVPAG
jgi:hypothetical protein